MSKCRAARDAMAMPTEIINEARNGRMFLLIDDQSDALQGYLVIPAQMATPQAINFMARHGRGLVCLALTKLRADQLALPMMKKRGGANDCTDFAVSIEAREGITTGISTTDRARTIAVTIDATKNSSHIVSPGHVFPLVVADGGLLVRAAPAEAAVDVARLAGLNASGVICAVMNQKGRMASLSDLRPFAHEHGMKIGTIRDLVVHRLGCDRNVARAAQVSLTSRHGGEWLVQAYVSKVDGAEHLVLQKGVIDGDRSVLVRMHPGSLLSDLLVEETSDAGGLQQAMDVIAEEGAGVIVIFRDTAPGSLSKLLTTHTAPTDTSKNQCVGAQILADLGVRRLTLLTSGPARAFNLDLERYGFDVDGHKHLAQTSGASPLREQRPRGTPTA